MPEYTLLGEYDKFKEMSSEELKAEILDLEGTIAESKNMLSTAYKELLNKQKLSQAT